MTDKEKAALGLLYNPNTDQELISELHHANDVVFEYNQIPPSQRERRNLLMRSFLGKCGEHFTILPPVHIDYGYNTEIGENFFANVNLVIIDAAKVRIGNNVFIAPNVGIYTAGHAEEVRLRRKGIEYAKPITIGHDVWIGGNVCILPGVTIGDGSIIGAGSVVTHDIPSDVIAVGNPCKALRKVKK
jgi:maltose O-acetyltransferase